MIAYNNVWLYNIYVRSQADEALGEQSISPDVHEAIYKGKHVGFYMPNFFVRIGLAVLTLAIVVFATLLLYLIFKSSIPFLLIFTGVACYATAEFLIRSKNHYNSGVDNVLVWMAALFVSAGIFGNISHDSDVGLIFSFIAFVIYTVLAVRFVDTVLSISAAVALLCFIFFCCQHTGGLTKTTAPFIMILASGGLYFVSANVLRRNILLLYRNCLRCVNIVALIALYGAGNYCFVREVNWEMSHPESVMPDTLPIGWFFWAWTFLVPLIYIGMGIRNKNITLIRTGLPFIAVAVLTFRYYHSILAPETAMLLWGALLFVVSWFLINYLRVPGNGFTFKPENYNNDRPDITELATDEFIEKATAGM